MRLSTSKNSKLIKENIFDCSWMKYREMNILSSVFNASDTVNFSSTRAECFWQTATVNHHDAEISLI